MSAKATFWAWDQDLKGSAKLTLLALANCENSKTKRCNPSVRFLSKQTGLDRKTINNCLNELKKSGLISHQNKKGSSNHYCLHTNKTWPKNGLPPSPKTGHPQISPPIPYLG